MATAWARIRFRHRHSAIRSAHFVSWNVRSCGSDGNNVSAVGYRYIERHHRLRQPLQGQRTNLFECRCLFDRHGNALAKQYLTVLGLGAQPCGDVADGANRGVAGALGKPDPPQRRRQRGSAEGRYNPEPVRA